ncbi:importin subunit beta-1 [Nematocida homosporus]|uniref:importin subunit beta-1 n=1 Tax=Nematocida homosporus TaxID=1912981 RepID=UPI0022210523|nr:importin subunit beta-1 [Nematocida homosporus]KAI5184516.1 importin subunit beta-1 [Nematocida homosporus]
MRDELLKALFSLQSADNTQRKTAESFIWELAENRFGDLLSELFVLLTDPRQAAGVALTAGMVLKIFFIWESAEKRAEVESRWVQLKESLRKDLRAKLLAGLDTCPDRAGDVLALCLAAVARIEVVSGRWPEVFNDLVSRARPDSPGQRNTVATIGALCADTTGMDRMVILEASGSILTAITMATHSSDNRVLLTAYKALESSLAFIAYNISIPGECRMIMETLFTGCAQNDDEVAAAAMKCFVSGLQLYPEQLMPAAQAAFSDAALSFLSSGVESKVLAGIDLWAVITEIEMDSEIYLVSAAFPDLLGALLNLLPREDPDEVEWTPRAAAAWLMAQVAAAAPDRVKGDLVGPKGRMPVIEAVRMFLQSSDPEESEAGLVALGGLLNEETGQDLSVLVNVALVVVFRALNDERPNVIDRGLWVLPRLFKYALPAMYGSSRSREVLDAVWVIIDRRPECAVDAAWALSDIFGAVVGTDTQYADDSIYNRYASLLGELWQRMFIGVGGGVEYGLQVALGSATCELLRGGKAQHRNELVEAARQAIVQARNELGSTQPREVSVSCALSILQVVASTSPGVVSPEEAVGVCLQVLMREGWSDLYTDAYLVLAAVADSTGAEFAGFMEGLVGIVVRDLHGLVSGGGSGFAAYSASLVTFIGAAAAASSLGFTSYVNAIVPALIKAVLSPGLPREARVVAVSSFADIALAVGKAFDRYIEAMVQLGASAVGISGEDPGFMLMLREALLDLLSCMVQASDGKSSALEENIGVVLEIIKRIVTETTDAACVVKSLYLISDLWMLYGSKSSRAQHLLDAHWILELVTAKAQSSIKEVREAACTTRLQISSIHAE